MDKSQLLSLAGAALGGLIQGAAELISGLSKQSVTSAEVIASSERYIAELTAHLKTAEAADKATATAGL